MDPVRQTLEANTARADVEVRRAGEQVGIRDERVSGLVSQEVRRFHDAPQVPGSVAPQFGASRDAFWLRRRGLTGR